MQLPQASLTFSHLHWLLFVQLCFPQAISGCALRPVWLGFLVIAEAPLFFLREAWLIGSQLQPQPHPHPHPVCAAVASVCVQSLALVGRAGSSVLHHLPKTGHLSPGLSFLKQHCGGLRVQKTASSGALLPHLLSMPNQHTPSFPRFLTKWLAIILLLTTWGFPTQWLYSSD